MGRVIHFPRIGLLSYSWHLASFREGDLFLSFVFPVDFFYCWKEGCSNLWEAFWKWVVLLLRPKQELRVSTNGELRVQRKCYNDGQQSAHICYIIISYLRSWPCGPMISPFGLASEISTSSSPSQPDFDQWQPMSPWSTIFIFGHPFKQSMTRGTTAWANANCSLFFSLTSHLNWYSRKNEKWKQSQVQHVNAGWVNFERFMRRIVPTFNSRNDVMAVLTHTGEAR